MSDASSSPRLPTRCPVCKGALVQRMPGTRHGTYISFHCMFCSHIWKFRLEDHREDPNGDLTGDVFIVTKRGVKHKLGSVEIYLIPGEELKKHLESKTLHSEVENEKLQRQIDHLVETSRTAEEEEDRLWQVLKSDENNPQKRQAWSVAYDKTKNTPKQLEGLKIQRRNLTSGDYFFE